MPYGFRGRLRIEASAGAWGAEFPCAMRAGMKTHGQFFGATDPATK
jgi:hypothetical protein